MRSSARLWGPVAIGAGLLVPLVATTSCRKPPPEEHVYTGAPRSTAPTPTSPAPTGTGASSGTTPEGFDKLGLLGAIADCAVDRARHFDGVATALRDAARVHAAERTPTRLAELRAAWATAQASWQEAEVFRFGPAASSVLPGGKDFREQIYSWPLVNRCKIDDQTVSQHYTTPAFATSLVNARGLSTIEYLTFYAGTDNGCSASAAINVNGTWAALSPDALAQRKADYARATAENVADLARGLRDAWEPTGKNFRDALARPGGAASPYPLDRDALNAISDAMFYIEREVKDLKLARPLGVSPDCTAARCPELVESPWAAATNAHLAANLVGFRRLLEGCGDDGAGPGFDDWLRSVGAGATADRMITALAGARAALAALDQPLQTAMTTSPEKADALYVAVKGITDVLKTDFVTVLDLELPRTVEGDND